MSTVDFTPAIDLTEDDVVELDGFMPTLIERWKTGERQQRISTADSSWDIQFTKVGGERDYSSRANGKLANVAGCVHVRVFKAIHFAGRETRVPDKPWTVFEGYLLPYPGDEWEAIVREWVRGDWESKI